MIRENYRCNVMCILITTFPRLEYDASRSQKDGKMFQFQKSLWQKKRLNFTSIHRISKERRLLSRFVARKIPMFDGSVREGGKRSNAVRRISEGARGERESAAGRLTALLPLRNRKNYCPETSLWRRAACNSRLQVEYANRWTTEQRYLCCSRPVPPRVKGK